MISGVNEVTTAASRRADVVGAKALVMQRLGIGSDASPDVGS